ncbi:MAG: CRISPR-associated helicase Cas3' [Thermoplasmata archaeon]|nr:MAG: CRISPR-associated helicase Cas3' [Thermoplasmata archaeon]
MERIEWGLEFEKESHPNKCLFCHVDEVRRIFRRFAKFFEIDSDKEVLDIIEKVIEYHDKGKLHKDWSIENENRVTHSDKSAEYYKKDLSGRVPTEKDVLITYLILKHHASLSTTTSFEGFARLIESFKVPGAPLNRWFFEGKFKDIKRRILLADLYGLFKLADCLSASGNTSYLPVKPRIDIKEIEKILHDKNRLEKERKLTSMGRLAFLAAPTGWGKTMASPFYLIRDIKRAFFILPTITAINKLHQRFTSIFGEEQVDKYFYFYDVELYGRGYETMDVKRHLFWGKHFLKPCMITTVDQLLLSFLQVGSYHTKRVMFRNSALVIDEVHLLNPRMLYLLLFFMRRYWDIYNLSVLFMSATFPDGLKKVIKDFLGIKVDERRDEINEIEEYKRLCRVKVENRLDENILTACGEIAEKGTKKKILVVCNTVEQAIKVKRALEDYENIRSILIHGRFNYNDRKTMEELIDNLASVPHVLVSTQVCEVSLDISYDFLYTEVAPLPSLIQRFGRVNRKGKRTDKVNCYIYNADIKERGRYPYNEREIEEAKSILGEIDKMENEYMLIERLNDEETEEKILKHLDEAKNKLRLDISFESTTKTGYFFSSDVTEEEIQEILSYREDFTTLVIPCGDAIYVEDERGRRLREDLDRLLEKYDRAEKRDIESIVSRLKGYAVQAPIWYVRRAREDRRFGFPIIRGGKFVYHPSYGLVNMDLISKVVL